jgi:hypothetical protein
MLRLVGLLAVLLAAADQLHADPIGGREVTTGPGSVPFNWGLSVGADAAGNVVAAISADIYFSVPAKEEIRARRFDANGTPLGADFQVNVYTTGSQFWPTVATDPAGTFVVAWVSDGQDGDGYGIFARRFSSSGVPLAGEFQVNTYTTGDQLYPAAAMLPGGGFVIVWQGAAGQDGSGLGVVGRRFDAAGVPLGGEFQVNAYTTSDQRDAAVVGGPGGSFVVTWSGFGVEEPDDRGIYFRRFDGTGAPLGPDVHVNTLAPHIQDDPAIAMDASGRSVVVWVDTSPGPLSSGPDVFARRFDAAGTALGPEFKVNGDASGEQDWPVVAMDSASGAFVVLYRSERGDLLTDFPRGNVLGRRYDAAGVVLGPEFQVNTSTRLRQTPGGIALDGTGAFTGVWVSYQDTLIQVRRYKDPALVPVVGKRLSIVDTADPARRRIVFQSKDTTISTTPGVSANPVVDGAALHVFNGSGSGESACFALPASSWTAGGPADERTYVYADPTGVHGPCYRATLRGGKRAILKATCRATQQPIPYSLDEPTQGSVAVSFSSGSATYCTLFGGTVGLDSAAAGRFTARNANPPPTCPVPPAACP